MLLSQQGFYFCFSFKRDFLFLGNNETTFIHSLAQRTNQETSTPSRPSPILEGSTQENAETAIFLPLK